MISIIPSPALRYSNYSNTIASGSCDYAQSSTFSYTVPQDGWLNLTLQKMTQGFVFAKINGASVSSCYKNNGDINLGLMTNVYIPVKKGDVLTFSYTTTDNTSQYYTMYGLR
jgi:hypothetical protein